MRSYVVLGINRFEAMVSFYAERLGFGGRSTVGIRRTVG
jgi:hypothetical protein